MGQRGPDTTWWTIGGVRLRIRAAPRGVDPGAHCWWPLHRVARRAAQEGAPDRIRLDEFELVGTRDRRRDSPLWIYLHRRTQAELFASAEGEAFKLTASASDVDRGRFRTCSAIAAAEHAGLPDLSAGHVRTAATGVIAIERLGNGWTAHLDNPSAHHHDPGADRARLVLTHDCFANGRLVRWPLGPGGHRLGPDQLGDRFGRCPDHRCARCFRDPAGSVDREQLRLLHRALFTGDPAEILHDTLRHLEETEALIGLRVDPPTPRGPSRPRPPSPYRPLLRQIWPPPARGVPPWLN